jgi:hypothetical protein
VLFGSYEKAAIYRGEMNSLSFRCGVLDNILFNQEFKLDFESGSLTKQQIVSELSLKPFVEGFWLGRYSHFNGRNSILQNNRLPKESRFVVVGSAPSIEIEVCKSTDTYFVVLNPQSDHQLLRGVSLNKVVAAFNGEALTRALSSQSEIDFLKALPLVLVRSARDFRIATKFGLRNVCAMTDARTLMMHDYGFNAIQNVVVSLIAMQSKEIMVTGASLFLGENLARTDHQPKEFDPVRRFFGMRYHDPIANFIFINVLLQKNLINVDESLGAILRGGILSYGAKLDQQWGAYNLIDKGRLC